MGTIENPSTRHVFVSIGFGIASFVVAFSLGTVLTASTGIPLAGGLLNGVLTALVLTIGLLSTRFPGSATIMWIVFSIPATITTTLGPPGIYKVIIAVIAGAIWDSFYQFSNQSRWGLYVGGAIGSASIMVTIIFALSLGYGEQAEQALQRYKNYLVALVFINLVVTIVGIYIGEYVFNTRLSDLPQFRNILDND